MVDAARFAKGMTFPQYVQYVGTPENLKREGSQTPRRDWSVLLQTAYDGVRLSPAHEAAWKWLVAQPVGPAKVLAISEEWSSDCRRDIPLLAKLADTAGLELRIFTRDGQTMGRGPKPEPDSPNADLMADLLNHKSGQSFQSIPVVVFYAEDFKPLYRYTEFPAVYRKDRLRGSLNAAKAGETPEQAKQRADKDFMEMLGSPFFDVWRAAALDEWTAILYERLRVGSLA
jgi:thioredoxin family protein